MQDWIASLPEKTGRTIDQWVKLVQKEGPDAEAQRRDWLKKVHGFGTNAAWWIAERAAGKSDDSDPKQYLRDAVKYVEDMYAGSKAGLRPIHDRLIELVRTAGEVKICPCKTMVPLYRNHVVAQIKPTTTKRIDFGLCLKNAKKKLSNRLLETGGLEKGDRITHRIPISTPDEIDDDVQSWFRVAYDLDAK